MWDCYARRRRGKRSRELAENEVMAETDTWMMREMQGQRDMLLRMFNELQPLFNGRYPQPAFFAGRGAVSAPCCSAAITRSLSQALAFNGVAELRK